MEHLAHLCATVHQFGPGGLGSGDDGLQNFA
jgi:hypothetical protein